MPNLIPPDYPEGTAVVCHDAGAANIVINNLLASGRKNWRAYMCGPAEKLWETTFPEITQYDTLDSTLDGVELLITGTGWANNIEHESRKMAQSQGIRSVAIIDHWVNYADRFIRGGEMIWPDEFWVTDDYAMGIARKIFPGQIVLQIPNYYIDAQLDAIAAVDEVEVPELLYVLEPVRDDWGRNIPGEFQALDYFVGSLPQLGLPSGTVIRLRPHPSDPPEKYNDWVFRHSSLNVQMDDSLDIAQSLGRSSWVAGCESFALVLALMAHRKVYCTLPPWAPSCRLPHHGLIHLCAETKINSTGYRF